MSRPFEGIRGLSGRGALAFVLAIWGVMLVFLLAAIALHGRNIPFAEDWHFVAPLTGHEPDMLAWLWSQNSEHRLPVPRLVGLVTLKLTSDFRAGMVLNALLLGGVALAMILTARRIRGGTTSYADAFFPLVFLHLGHWDNILWSWQIQFVLATALTCALLLAVVLHDRVLSPALAIGASLALTALPLSGATGLMFVPLLAVWLAAIGLSRWRTPEVLAPGRWTGPLLVGAAVVAVLLTLAYFIGWQRPGWAPASPSLQATLRMAARFTAQGLGPGAAISWWASSIVAFGLLLAGATVLVGGTANAARHERLRALGLVFFAAGAAVLAVAIGWGRAGRATSWMSSRYALLAVPALCASYFVWELYGPPALRRIARGAFFVAVCVALPFNIEAGLARRDWFGRGMQAFERDLAASVPRSVLVERHHAFLLHWNPASLSASIQMLQQAGIGPFARMQDDTAPLAGESR